MEPGFRYLSFYKQDVPLGQTADPRRSFFRTAMVFSPTTVSNQGVKMGRCFKLSSMDGPTDHSPEGSAPDRQQAAGVNGHYKATQCKQA